MATRKKKATPKNFKAAYDILKTNAESLQSANDPDIDNLMTTVEESIAAYKVCQARIEAVQQALDAAFDVDSDSSSDDDSDNTVQTDDDSDIHNTQEDGDNTV